MLKRKNGDQMSWNDGYDEEGGFDDNEWQPQPHRLSSERSSDSSWAQTYDDVSDDDDNMPEKMEAMQLGGAGKKPSSSSKKPSSTQRKRRASTERGTSYPAKGMHRDEEEEGWDESPSYEPTEDEVETCENRMSMEELRDKSGAYGRMPRSVVINGRSIPKSQLRKHDLAREYLRWVEKSYRELKSS